MARCGWQIIACFALWFGITCAGCYNSHTTNESSVQTEQEQDSETEAYPKEPAADNKIISSKWDPLRIETQPDSAAISPGECVDIAVRVFGGNPPYHFSWDHELSSATTFGPHEVCPDADTTYAVTVHDTGLDSQEFVIPAEQARAELSVTIRDDCTAVSIDAGVDAVVDSAFLDASRPEGCAEAGLRKVCERTFRVTGAEVDLGQVWGTGHNLAIDHNEDVVLSGWYKGDLEMGETVLSSDGREACFVVKLGPDCSVRWALNLTGTESVYGSEVAIGTDNSIYFGAAYTGRTDFGDGLLPVNLTSHEWGLLIKLDPDGEMQWSRAFPALPGSDMATEIRVMTVAVDSQGRVNITGTGPGDMLIDGHSISREMGHIWSSFIVQLDADGAVRWVRQVQIGGHKYVGVAVAPDDTLVAFGEAQTSVNFGNFILEFSTFPPRRFLARLQADGELSWVKELPEEQTYSLDGGFFILLSSGDIVMLNHVYNYDLPIIDSVHASAVSLERYTAAGQFEWSRLNLRGYIDSAKLISDARIGLTRLESLAGTALYEGQQIISRGETDILLIRETKDGQPVWTCQLGDERFNNPWDVVVDSSHYLTVAYESYESYGSPSELTVVRLAPES
ncbi:MAG: hypothetical protein JXA30_21140 [Deltaproteobacteria bacterium]|nr:hypothetical protein [Deltaproteobacteria bacterium]